MVTLAVVYTSANENQRHANAGRSVRFYFLRPPSLAVQPLCLVQDPQLPLKFPSHFLERFLPREDRRKGVLLSSVPRATRRVLSQAQPCLTSGSRNTIRSALLVSPEDSTAYGETAR